MRPVKIKNENANFVKPRDWNESMGGCGNLSVRREPFGATSVSMFSNWKPSAHELAVLNAGGVVELECVGVQPAVSVAAVPCADSDATRNDDRNDFADRISIAVNNANRESVSNTPDFILGKFMTSALSAAEALIHERDRWYGIAPEPGKVEPPKPESMKVSYLDYALYSTPAMPQDVIDDLVKRASLPPPTPESPKVWMHSKRYCEERKAERLLYDDGWWTTAEGERVYVDDGCANDRDIFLSPPQKKKQEIRA